MHSPFSRRRALKVGAAAVTLRFTVAPLAGCGPAPHEVGPPPQLPPRDPRFDPVPDPEGGPGGAGSGAPSATASPSAEPSAPGSAAPSEGPAPDASAQPVSTPAPASRFARVIGKVGKNHGHEIVIPFADVQAGAEKSYDLRGKSDHPHAITLSGDDMKALLAGGVIRMKSSRDKQHAHRVLVRCGPAVDPPEWIPACDATFSGQDEHELVVPIADLTGKADRTYDVQGIAGHAHDLTIPAAGFDKLLKGEALSIQTTRNDAHGHVVFIQYLRPKKV